MLRLRSEIVTASIRRILVTGANGFLGKNLVVRMNELPGYVVKTFNRGDDVAGLPDLVANVDAVVHLAGENRPVNEDAFALSNIGLTSILCKAIQSEYEANGRNVSLVLASSIQAERDNPYGLSKLAAEEIVRGLSQSTSNPCIVFRLPGVFGKWSKPNYNSVVATFCHNIARGIPIQINDGATKLRLVYIDDVVNSFLDALKVDSSGYLEITVDPEYIITLEELANQIYGFGDCKASLMIDRVGTGLIRALYATYMSFLPRDEFFYTVPQYADARGVFVEMLKTHDSGQFSYFTAYPGITRGGHYHHTKSEKFLVVKGEALFRFRHLLTGDLIEIRTCSSKPQVVDTIPGWTHDIKNVGDDEMIVMLWANENFDRLKPDTVSRDI